MSTQLYLLAPLVFIPLFRWPRFGLGLTIAIIVLSPLSTLSPRILLGHPTYLEAGKFGSISEGIRGFLNYHTNPVQYVTALSIGLLTGYLIKCKPNMRIPGGRVTELILWLSSFSSIVLIFAWHNSFWEINKVNSEYNILAWFVMSKFMIASSLGFISYMCCTGRGGECLWSFYPCSTHHLSPVLSLQAGSIDCSLFDCCSRLPSCPMESTCCVCPLSSTE